MSRKIMIILGACIIVILIAVLIKNATLKNKKNSVELSEAPQNGDEIIFGNNTQYKAIYNAGSLVYEIYDENDNLLCVTPDEASLELYAENPEMMYVAENEILLEE